MKNAYSIRLNLSAPILSVGFDLDGTAVQRIINSSLTPLYLQHEAIQAQLAMANGTNHTVISIPTGDSGIPLVRDTSNDVPGPSK